MALETRIIPLGAVSRPLRYLRRHDQVAMRVFDVDRALSAVATITAAVPIGANVFIMAHKYEVYLARVTSAVVISAALSVLTLAVALTVLVPG